MANKNNIDQNFIVNVSRLKRHLLCGYGYFTSILDPLNYSGDTMKQKIVLKNECKIRWIRQWMIDINNNNNNDTSKYEWMLHQHYGIINIISKYADYYPLSFHKHYHKTPSTSPAISEEEDC